MFELNSDAGCPRIFYLFTVRNPPLLMKSKKATDAVYPICKMRMQFFSGLCTYCTYLK